MTIMIVTTHVSALLCGQFKYVTERLSDHEAAGGVMPPAVACRAW